jgi:hypothetical protein
LGFGKWPRRGRFVSLLLFFVVAGQKARSAVLLKMTRQSMGRESLIGFADKALRAAAQHGPPGHLREDGTSCLLPVVTKSVRRDGWQNSDAKNRAARTDVLFLRSPPGNKK